MDYLKSGYRTQNTGVNSFFAFLPASPVFGAGRRSPFLRQGGGKNLASLLSLWHTAEEKLPGLQLSPWQAVDPIFLRPGQRVRLKRRFNS
jgi:hypothetical protein